MPINRLTAPVDPPTTNADWTRMKAIVDALLLHQEQPLRVVGTNVVKGALFQIGGTAYLADADTAITGTPSEYVKITPSGDGSTCSASFVSSLTGVTWNTTYNGYYDAGSPASLYIFDEGKALTAGQIDAIMNTKNQVIELGAGWLATFATAIAAGWAMKLAAVYVEPCPMPIGNHDIVGIAAEYTFPDMNIGELASIYIGSGQYVNLPSTGNYKVQSFTSGTAFSNDLHKIMPGGSRFGISFSKLLIERIS